jgi:uncharacterized cupin superfamily protein
MQPTLLPGVALWSRWQADRALFFNSWYVHGAAGAMLVDPLDADADVLAAIDARALDAIVITNRDHERAAAFYAERYRAPVIAASPDADEMTVTVQRRVTAGDEICGWRVVPFDGLKTRGEFALFDPVTRAAIVGDAVWGAPAGALRLMPEEKLGDPALAALSLRRLLSLDVRHLLTGDGTPIYERAADALQAMLDARSGVAVRRINLDELVYRRRVGPGPYQCDDGEIGFWIGARSLGYRVARLAPGEAFCPYHWHAVEEELFIVWDGTPALRTPTGTYRLRRGDFVAFPTGAGGAHRLHNDGPGTAVVVMLSSTGSDFEACFYPDSRKVLVEHGEHRVVVRGEPQLEYYDGE